MIRLKRHWFADATLVVGLGTASGTAELGLAGQFVDQPGVGHSAYFRVFTFHDIHPLFSKNPSTSYLLY